MENNSTNKQLSTVLNLHLKIYEKLKLIKNKNDEIKDILLDNNNNQNNNNKLDIKLKELEELEKKYNELEEEKVELRKKLNIKKKRKRISSDSDSDTSSDSDSDSNTNTNTNSDSDSDSDISSSSSNSFHNNKNIKKNKKKMKLNNNNNHINNDNEFYKKSKSIIANIIKNDSDDDMIFDKENDIIDHQKGNEIFKNYPYRIVNKLNKDINILDNLKEYLFNNDNNIKNIAITLIDQDTQLSSIFDRIFKIIRDLSISIDNDGNSMFELSEIDNKYININNKIENEINILTDLIYYMIDYSNQNILKSFPLKKIINELNYTTEPLFDFLLNEILFALLNYSYGWIIPSWDLLNISSSQMKNILNRSFANEPIYMYNWNINLNDNNNDNNKEEEIDIEKNELNENNFFNNNYNNEIKIDDDNKIKNDNIKKSINKIYGITYFFIKLLLKNGNIEKYLISFIKELLYYSLPRLPLEFLCFIFQFFPNYINQFINIFYNIKYNNNLFIDIFFQQLYYYEKIEANKIFSLKICNIIEKNWNYFKLNILNNNNLIINDNIPNNNIIFYDLNKYIIKKLYEYENIFNNNNDNIILFHNWYNLINIIKFSISSLIYLPYNIRWIKKNKISSNLSYNLIFNHEYNENFKNYIELIFNNNENILEYKMSNIIIKSLFIKIINNSKLYFKWKNILINKFNNNKNNNNKNNIIYLYIIIYCLIINYDGDLNIIKLLINWINIDQNNKFNIYLNYFLQNNNNNNHINLIEYIIKKKYNSIPESYIINLYDREKRFYMTTKQFSNLGLLYERYEAIDGRNNNNINISINEVSTQWNTKLNYKYDKTIKKNSIINLSLTERATILSHLNIWKKIQNYFNNIKYYSIKKNIYYDNNSLSSKYVFIFEDDIIFDNQFRIKFQKILKNLSNDIDIILLGYILPNSIDKEKLIEKERKKRNNKKKNKDIKLNENDYYGDLFKPTFFWGAHSYALTKNGVNKLLNKLPITSPIDVWLAELINNGYLNGYAPRKTLVWQNKKKFDSDIMHSGSIEI